MHSVGWEAGSIAMIQCPQLDTKRMRKTRQKHLVWKGQEWRSRVFPVCGRPQFPVLVMHFSRVALLTMSCNWWDLPSSRWSNFIMWYFKMCNCNQWVIHQLTWQGIRNKSSYFCSYLRLNKSRNWLGRVNFIPLPHILLTQPPFLLSSHTVVTPLSFKQ